MNVVLNVSTMDSAIRPSNYPAGKYRVNVINQRQYSPLSSDHFAVPVRWIRTETIGLSKSRNEGLRALNEDDIVLISDDDVEYLPGFERAVCEAYANLPGADVVLFQVRTPEGQDFKRYPSRVRRYGLRDIMRACSIEISLRWRAIGLAGISFDERFGLGAPYATGEDIIFLADCLRAGLTVMFVPVPICIHKSESSGSAHTEQLLFAKGAMFRRALGPLGIVASIAYCAKKIRPTSDLAFLRAVRACVAGAIK